MKPTKLLLAFWFTAILSAQAPSKPASITAVGQATVSATPDLAQVNVGVNTQAATAQDATTTNATQAANVIAALQGLLGASATIKTISYSLSPVYNNPLPGQNSTIVGYMVTNIVQASLKDLTQIGKAIDTAIQSGANNVQGVSFSLQDQSPVQAQALKMAAATALTQAGAIAAGLNVHTGAVLRAVEALNAYPLPIGVAGAAANTTPIETGLVVVQASVTLEVAIAQ
jgi:uncharacterized protein YggE